MGIKEKKKIVSGYPILSDRSLNLVTNLRFIMEWKKQKETKLVRKIYMPAKD